MMALFRPATLAFRLAGPALAQSAPLGGMITGLDVDRIAEIARVYGSAERQLEAVADGPGIRGETDGTIYTISFLNCTNGQNCSVAQFRAWWHLQGARDIGAMNAWMRDRRFSDADIDQSGNATIE